ncbi:MAG TPA: trehalose-phosphatase [Terriglobales bacterium]|nr:trehalose-phosphatase [Terriglobales bacterium]
MSVASHHDVRVEFLAKLRYAQSRVLLLDYDGTLAPFTPDRERAFPYPEIPELVSRILRAGTRVVLISGRPATELLYLSGVHPPPEIWGSHGAERLLPDGSYQVDPPLQAHQLALRATAQSLHACGFSSQMEIKPGGIAVHWRGLPPEQREPIEAKVRTLFASAAKEHGLVVLPFDGGLEVRASGKNKGDAVSAVLAEAGSGVAAAYLGDDHTDENAFRAIKGRGIAILVRPEPRPTTADIWLRPPEELSRFFRDWLKACGAENETAGRPSD